MTERGASVIVVGAGRAGMVHARNHRWHVPRSRLAGIVEADPERARGAVLELDLPESAAFGDLEAALASIDADGVIITTPTFTHADLVVAAAAAGRHVLCEKPLALSLDECDRIAAAVAGAGIAFEVGFMRHFDRGFVEAERRIREGAIGEPVLIRSLTRGPGLPPPWANDPATSNGMLAEVNSHDLDTVRWLMASEIRSVFARVAALKVPQLRERFPAFYDTAIVVLELESGALGVVEGLCPATYGYDARAEVTGTEGTLLVGDMAASDVTSVRADEGTRKPFYPSWRDRFREAYIAEDRHFVERILDGAPQVNGVVSGRRAVELVLAASESIRTRAPVTLGGAEAGA